MRIYNASNQLILDVEVDDKSYRRREIMGENALYLYFSLSYFIDVEVGAYTDYDGERYYLLEPNNFKKHHSRSFEYSLVMEPSQALLRDAKFKYFTLQGEGYSDFEVKFSLVFTPARFAELLVANMNLTDSGWAVGDCIEAPEQLINFSADSCEQALTKIAEAFRTEFEVAGKTIHIRKVEKDKTSAVALGYGKNKGFLPGLGRSNYDGSKLVNRIYVNASDRNIDSSVYGHTTLRMPKSRAFTYEGVDYVTDPSGTWLEVANRVGRCIEETIDLTNIYPKRVGTATSVVAVDDSKALYDFTDTSIPETLNFTQTVIPSETLSVVFQTGNLAGYEFDVEYIHASRLFRIIPITENGASLPKSPLIPAVGDEYAVFHTQLPEQYVTDASELLLAEAVKQLHELQQPKFTFTGTLDEVFAHNNWLEVGGKLNPGSYVSFSDGQFLSAAELIRIVAVKEFINKPKALVIDLSNEVSGKALTAVLNELKGYDQAIAQAKKEAMSYSKRLWQVTQELLDAVYDPDGSFQTELTSSTALLSLMARIGTQSLQFRFRDITTGAVIVPNFAFANGVFSVPLCMLDHMTMGITSIKPSLNESDRKQWRMNAYASPSLESSKKYYLYAKCSVANIYGTGGAFIGDGVFVLSETEIQLEQVPNYYHFWVGFLHTEYEGERTFSPMYGYSEILPGQITTNRLQSDDAQTVIDLVQGIIEGKFIFKSGSSGYANLTDKPDLSVYSERSYVDAITANLQAQVDGVVDNWFYPYSPSLANYPASEWTTNTLKDRHIGDTFTNTQEFVDNATTPDAGKSWRFVKNGSVYSWSLIADSDAVKALLAASKAQDTADGKRRVFLVTPTTPYEAGDLWTQGTSGDLMRCKTTRLTGSYTAADWEKAVKYTDDTAVNNLAIGARNILKGSEAKAGGKWTTSATGTFTADIVDGNACQKVTFVEASGATNLALFQSFTPLQITDLLWKGRTLVASVQLMADVNANFSSFRINVRWEEGGQQNNATFSGAFSLVAGQWSTIHVKVPDFPFHPADKSSLLVYFVLISSDNWVGRTLWIRRNMLSFSTTPTDWTPAPEDVQAGIDAATQAAANAQSTANTASTNVNNLNTYVDGAFKDGVIETSEAKAIEKYINSVNESWTDFESTYNVLYANNYLEGTPKTNLLNAKVSLAGAKDNLLSSINTAIADGKTTAAEKADVDSKFSAFNSAVASFKTAVENANKAIQSKLDTISAGYANTASQAAAAAQSTANDAAAAASTANSNIADITNDNKFTPDEKSAVRREWEIIAAEKSANDSQADAFGVSKTTYGTKFQTLANYLNNGTTWSSGIPSWISDALMAITTNIDGPTFRLRFKEYYDARTALLNAIATKAKQLADTAQSTVDNIQIGGRNLISNIEANWEQGTISSTNGNNSSNTTRIRTKGYVSVSASQITINRIAAVDVYILEYDENFAYLGYVGSSLWATTFPRVASLRPTTKFIRVVIRFPDDSTILPSYIGSVALKIEKGNKPTDWTPAPEDVQAGIDSANAAIAAIADDGKFTPNEKQLVRREWDSLLSQYYNYGFQAASLGIVAELEDMEFSFLDLAKYLNNGVTWTSGIPLWISDSQLAVITTVDPATFRLKFSNYYGNLNNLITEIGIATKANVDAAAALAASNNYLKEALKNNTDIQGGLLSTTLIKLGAVNQSGSWVEKAGINGAGTTDNTPRIYAGGTLQQAINRIAGQLTNAAKFVVTQGGKIFGMEVELVGSFRTAPPGGKHIHISHEAGAVNIHDDNGDVKSAISADAIPTLASLLAPNSTTVNAALTNSESVSNNAVTMSINKVLSLPSTSSNYTITTPPVVCSLAVQTTDPNDPMVYVAAFADVMVKLIKPDSSEILLGTLSVGVLGINQSDSQSQTIPAQSFESMPSGDYTLRVTVSVDAASTFATASSIGVISSPNHILAGVSVVEVSRILRNGLFLIQDANNYAYLNPTGIVEKSQVAPNRPGVLLSGRGLSGGSADALWGPKKHSTLTVAKASTGTYTVYHSIGHTNYSVQVTPIDASRSVRWANYQADRFTIYTYNGSTLADANFSFAVFGDN